MTPKAAILDAEDNLLLSNLDKLLYLHYCPFLLSNLDKPLYLHCNEHDNVPIPIPTYDYIVINRSLLCDCQLQGRSEFLQ